MPRGLVPRLRRTLTSPAASPSDDRHDREGQPLDLLAGPVVRVDGLPRVVVLAARWPRDQRSDDADAFMTLTAATGRACPLGRGANSVSSVRLIKVRRPWTLTPECDQARGMRTTAAAEAFLSQGRIAVTGVSRAPKDHGANVVYRRLRDRGYDVFAVNPNAATVEGDDCFPDLGAVPGGVDAVVIATRPEYAIATVQECIDLGIDKVWMHRGPGGGSVSAEAAELGRRHQVLVLDGGCPCMFGPTSDLGHRLMRTVLTVTGAVPRTV